MPLPDTCIWPHLALNNNSTKQSKTLTHPKQAVSTCVNNLKKMSGASPGLLGLVRMGETGKTTLAKGISGHLDGQKKYQAMSFLKGDCSSPSSMAIEQCLLSILQKQLWWDLKPWRTVQTYLRGLTMLGCSSSFSPAFSTSQPPTFTSLFTVFRPARLTFSSLLSLALTVVISNGSSLSTSSPLAWSMSAISINADRSSKRHMHPATIACLQNHE